MSTSCTNATPRLSYFLSKHDPGYEEKGVDCIHEVHKKLLVTSCGGFLGIGFPISIVVPPQNVIHNNKPMAKTTRSVRLVCTECFKKLEGEAFMIPKEKKKKTSAEVSEALSLISEYKSLFVQGISPEQPILNTALCINMASKQIKLLGLERVRTLLHAYLSSDDKFYKDCVYSLTLFLSDNTINKLNVLTPR